MMKKVLLSLCSVTSVFLLAACQPSSNQDVETEKEFKATVVVDFGDKTDSKEVTFEKEDSVMDILEDHFEVKEEAGMVTSINGVSQDASKNTYWMYDINDEMAPKGAEEMTINEGDTITFYLETFE